MLSKPEMRQGEGGVGRLGRPTRPPDSHLTLQDAVLRINIDSFAMAPCLVLSAQVPVCSAEVAKRALAQLDRANKALPCCVASEVKMMHQALFVGRLNS